MIMMDISEEILPENKRSILKEWELARGCHRGIL